jgi:cell division protein FtsQ
MKKVIYSLLGVIGISSAFVGLFIYAERSGFFKLEKVDVVIHMNQSKEVGPSLNSYLAPLIKDQRTDIEKLKGQSIWALDVKTLAEQMRKKDWIESVQIQRDWPNRLEISIQPKEFGALFIKTNGDVHPMGMNGEIFNSTSLAKAPDLPVIRGSQFEQKKDLRIQALKLLKSLPSQGSFSKKTISEIGYDDKEGFWLSVLPSKISVKMGFDSDPSREERVSQVIDYLDRNNIQGRVIDANFAKKVLVKLRKDP